MGEKNNSQGNDFIGLAQGLIVGAVIGSLAGLFTHNTGSFIIICTSLGGIIGVFSDEIKNHNRNKKVNSSV